MSMPDSSTSSVAVSFPRVSGLTPGSQNAKDLVGASFATSSPSSLFSWPGTDGLTHLSVGCDDGSIYVFAPVQREKIVNTTGGNPGKAPTLSPSLQLHHGSPATSRSASPSSSFNMMQSPLTIASRSRVVSGVTTEAIEAPKNYVDFDDEPGKLKEMLKARVTKDKASGDKASNDSLHVPSSQRSSVSDTHRVASLASLSLSTPPERSPALPSPPPPKASPFPAKPVELRYHILPSHSREGNYVSDFKVLHANKILVSLHSSGCLSAFAIEDGRCLTTYQTNVSVFLTPSGTKTDTHNQNAWLWRSFKAIPHGELTLIIATAINDPNIPVIDSEDGDQLDDHFRIAIFGFRSVEQIGSLSASLTLLGDWVESGQHPDIIHLPTSDTLMLLFFNTTSQVTVKHFQVGDENPLAHSMQSDSESLKLPTLNIPNPFKNLKSPSTEHLAPNPETSQVVLLDAFNADFAGLPGSQIMGLKLQLSNRLVQLLAWTGQQMQICQLHDKHVSILHTEDVAEILNIEWTSATSYTMVQKDMVSMYDMDPANDQVDLTNSHLAQKTHSLSLPILTAVTSVSCQDIYSLTDGLERSLYHLSSESASFTKLWTGVQPLDVKPPVYLTSSLPIHWDKVVLGYSDGCIRQTSWASMAGGDKDTMFWKTSDPPLHTSILKLCLVSSSQTKDQFVVGGGDDGSIALWALKSLTLAAHWMVLATPLANAVQVPEQRGPLSGCVLCISRGGTIAVISIDGLQLLYLIPGAPATLQQISLGGDDLLLFYSNQLVRLWDIKSKEFWRSMMAEKAHEHLAQGSWISLSIDDADQLYSKEFSAGIGFSQCQTNLLDFASTLAIDIQSFLDVSNPVIKTVSTGLEQTHAIYAVADQIRALLSSLLSWGLNKGMDDICQHNLSIQPSSTFYGLQSFGSTVLYTSKLYEEWTISGTVSATLCLSIVSLLKALSLFEEFAEACNSVITFYTTSLYATIGSTFQPPNLPFLASNIFTDSIDVQQAAKVIFDAAVIQLPDEDAISTTLSWHQSLPSVTSTLAHHDISFATVSLCICGSIAAEKHSLLPANVLTDIARSIHQFLQSPNLSNCSLAIDLCARGFQVWQHYTDAVEILRSLFLLGTTTQKNSISIYNTASQARAAVISIASSNTPLFITTLSMDILSPSTMEYRKSVMQIVAFLIRKRPLVLYTNLPRLMEAVVKSLDPNSTAHREAVLDAATQIISNVVKIYPTVDFSMGSQRLAVGTSEGAVIMYDLKTGTRLYVLEGHKKRISACSFSPDGRRLVSISLEENVVLVWKVGSSFTSLFTPGLPPRQGHGGSEPYKRFPFNIGQEGEMTVAATLEWLCIEWPSSRNVKLTIRESILTFST